jgi:hypothetical protein
MMLIQDFFLDYNDAPLLIINAADINLESNENRLRVINNQNHV